MNRHPEDNLDPLLARPTTACDDDLRRSLLVQTTSFLRQRRRQRRMVVVAASAAAVLLAISGVFIMRNRDKPVGPIEDGGPGVADTMPATLAADAPAAAIERFGETSPPAQRSALYRRAGDTYLDEAADPQDALRCYTQSLDDGSEADVTVSADDSWLLMALKMDRNKEKKNANRD